MTQELTPRPTMVNFVPLLKLASRLGTLINFDFQEFCIVTLRAKAFWYCSYH